jgi:transcriptional regulator with XRE-family HTH domain
MAKTDSTSLRQLLAKNVRLIRNIRGWSQEKLAEKAELHRTYIGSIERSERNVSIDNIAKLSRALQVKPARLLSDERK